MARRFAPHPAGKTGAPRPAPRGDRERNQERGLNRHHDYAPQIIEHAPRSGLAPFDLSWPVLRSQHAWQAHSRFLSLARRETRTQATMANCISSMSGSRGSGTSPIDGLKRSSDNYIGSLARRRRIAHGRDNNQGVLMQRVNSAYIPDFVGNQCPAVDVEKGERGQHRGP